MSPERQDVAARLARSPAPGATPTTRAKPDTQNPWDAAVDVHDFVNSVEPESDWLVPRLIARGAVTAWFSPRGIGKTLVAHHVAVDLARQGIRVLLIDRDNPRREVKRRLRAWRLSQVERERYCHEDLSQLTTEELQLERAQVVFRLTFDGAPHPWLLERLDEIDARLRDAA